MAKDLKESGSAGSTEAYGKNNKKSLQSWRRHKG